MADLQVTTIDGVAPVLAGEGKGSRHTTPKKHS
jgi:hypothetical protein